MKYSRRKVAEKAIELLEKVHDLIRDRTGGRAPRSPGTATA